MRWEADRSRITRQIGHAQALTLLEHHRQQSVTHWRRADQRPLFGCDTRRDKGVDAARRRRDGQRTVAGVEQIGGVVDYLLQDDVQAELARHVQSGLVQREELAVLMPEPRLHALDPTEDGLAEQ